MSSTSKLNFPFGQQSREKDKLSVITVNPLKMSRRTRLWSFHFSPSNASNTATSLDDPSAPSVVLLVLVDPCLSMDLRRSERETTGDLQFDSSSTRNGSRSSDPTATSKSTTTMRLRSTVFLRRSRRKKSFVSISIEFNRFNRISTRTSTNGSLQR